MQFLIDLQMTLFGALLVLDWYPVAVDATVFALHTLIVFSVRLF